MNLIYSPAAVAIACFVIGLPLFVVSIRACLTLSRSAAWIWPSLLGLVMLVFAIAAPATVYITRAVGRTQCDSFSTQTGRPTKFAVYHGWSFGQCLTPSANGEWIPTSALRQFSEQP